MPVMSGEEALPLIKAMRPDIPVIISSGFSETEILRRFESSGIASVIGKPNKMPVFISKVVEVARRRSAEEVEQVVQQYRASGLSQREFSEQTGIKLSTLGRYVRRDRAV